MSFKLLLLYIVILLGLVTTVKGSCQEDPFVLKEVNVCLTLIANASTDGSDCVTTEERSRLLSVVQKGDDCLQEVFTAHQCEQTFTEIYQGILMLAYSQANTYRCAGDCRNDTELQANLTNCFTDSLTPTDEDVDCQMSFNQTNTYDMCVQNTLRFSGCARNFTNQWKVLTDSMWEVHNAVCGQDYTCFDNSEIFGKTFECDDQIKHIQLEGYDLGQYCSATLNILVPCIEEILTEATCDEYFSETVRNKTYRHQQQFCSEDRLCDYRLMECLNSTEFTFTVEPNDHQVTCRNLQSALDQGRLCLERDYGCVPNRLEDLEHTLTYHRDLYQDLCLGGDNCIFDNGLKENIELCFDVPLKNGSYCRSTEMYHDYVHSCYTDALSHQSCSDQSEEYYHRLYHHSVTRVAEQCGLKCSDVDHIMWQIYSCHQSVNLVKTTANVSDISQVESFCSSLQNETDSLIACIGKSFEQGWCEDSVKLQALAQAEIYSNLYDLFCKEEELELIYLGLQCDSFSELVHTLHKCSKNVFAKVNLMHTQTSGHDFTSSVCQDITYLSTDTMQCLTSELYSLHCPTQLPAALTHKLSRSITAIQNYCTEIPAVGGGSCVSLVSFVLTLTMTFLQLTIIQ